MNYVNLMSNKVDVNNSQMKPTSTYIFDRGVPI